MLLRNLFNLHRLMDEANPDSGSTGGGGTDIVIDIDKASDAIGADLGLNEGAGTDDLLDGSSATPPKKDETVLAPTDEAGKKAAAEKAGKEAAEKAAAVTKLADAKKLLTDKKVDFTGKADADILKLAEGQGTQLAPKGMPKSWAAAQAAIWAKMPPEAQAYVEQREAQVEEGFKANAPAVHYAKELSSIIGKYDTLLQSQGVKDHRVVVSTLLNSHYILSTKDAAGKAAFLAEVAKNYGVDLDQALAAFKAGPPAETAEAKELRERMDRIEADKRASDTAAFETIKAQSANEVAAFAADPAHPYFNEVAGDVALLLKADEKMNLATAYERAVYANPVTRAKELSRLKEAAEKTAREEAEEKAKAAEKARGTRVRGQEEHRESPDLLGTMEDTMRDTYKKINNRT